MLQFPRWKVDVTVEGVPVETFQKTFYETATTAAAAIGKAKHKMRGAVSSAGAFKFKASKADEPSGHATKKKSPAQLQREIDGFLAGLPADVKRGLSSTPADELLEYAQKRANATGRPYAISNMGHVQVADAHNKRTMRDELGGIALVVEPSRSAGAGAHATKHASGFAFDEAKEAWDDDPSARTAEKYRRVAREYHREGQISNSVLDEILVETAGYVSPTKRSHAKVIASKQTSLLPPSVRVARAGLDSVRKHGIKNLRYGLYRHATDRGYQWGNFTGTPEHVITAIVPNAKNTASQEALVRALKWKR
jgi:hypothetical protein